MYNNKLWIVIAVLSSLLVWRAAGADYLAYSVGEREKTPLPERLDGIEAKHLLNVEWGAYSGRKARLGVLPVDNNSTAASFTISSAAGNIDYSTSTAGVSVNGIEAIVIDSPSG